MQDEENIVETVENEATEAELSDIWEEEADTADDFDDDTDEVEDTSCQDDGGDDGELEEEPEEEAENLDGRDAESEEHDEPEHETEGDKGDQLFSLKYMDETKSVNADEVVVLAQKGLDYDRIREDRDNLKSKLADFAQFETYKEFLEEIAKSSNVDIPTLIDQTRARMLINEKEEAGEEISEEEAMRLVTASREAKAAKKASAVSEEDKKLADERAQQSKRQESFKRFVEYFPNVDAATIPKEVWEDFLSDKGDLVDVYARYENKKLRAELEAERKNKKNRERSVGARTSTGKSTRDEFDDIWDD